MYEYLIDCSPLVANDTITRSIARNAPLPADDAPSLFPFVCLAAQNQFAGSRNLSVVTLGFWFSLNVLVNAGALWAHAQWGH